MTNQLTNPCIFHGPLAREVVLLYAKNQKNHLWYFGIHSTDSLVRCATSLIHARQTFFGSISPLLRPSIPVAPFSPQLQNILSLISNMLFIALLTRSKIHSCPHSPLIACLGLHSMLSRQIITIFLTNT